MVRWLAPRSGPGRLAVQILLLVVLAVTVYLVVTWLGSSLDDPLTPV